MSKAPVICIECIHCQKPLDMGITREDTIRAYTCTATLIKDGEKETLSYVIGTRRNPKPVRCKQRNVGGRCEHFKAKEKP